MAYQFYETGILYDFAAATPDDPSRRETLALQVLTSPPQAEGGAAVPYEVLLDGFDFVQRLTVSGFGRGGFEDWALLIAHPDMTWEEIPEGARVELRWSEMPLEVAQAFESFLNVPLVPTETSPLNKRSLTELGATGGTIFLAVFADLPTIVIVGGGVGLVVLRTARAVGGALWEGARPEVVDFGSDAAAAILDALRRKLGIRSGTHAGR